MLYANQPYEDNHTDESFLAELVLNRNVRRRRYWPLVAQAAAVGQQLDVTVGAATVFHRVLHGALRPDPLLAAAGACPEGGWGAQRA